MLSTSVGNEKMLQRRNYIPLFALLLLKRMIVKQANPTMIKELVLGSGVGAWVIEKIPWSLTDVPELFQKLLSADAGCVISPIGGGKWYTISWSTSIIS